MFEYVLKMVAIAILLVVSGCQQPGEVEEVLRPVRIMEVSTAQQAYSRVFPGKMSPVQEVDLSFRVSNQLRGFPVKEGQYLRKGEVIATLDSRDFEIAVRNISGRLDEARANLRAMLAGAREEDVKALESQVQAARVAYEEAVLQYERHVRLYEMGAVARAMLDNVRSSKESARSKVRSLEMELEKALVGARPEDIEAARARIASLEAGLDEARSALEDSILRAPFDGHIAERYVEDHENIAAGQPVVRFQDSTRMEVTIGLPEQLLVQKNLIKSIHVRLETFPRHYLPARIKEISTAASPMTLSYRLTAVLDRPADIPVYPSMAADVYIAFGLPREYSGFVFIPETALVPGEGFENKVWIFDSSTKEVRSRRVTPGQISGQGIQILDGLVPGEMIIVAGAEFLEEGQQVRPVNNYVQKGI
ncbi:efflux RND transporter periplasmic adaptor subunit [Desulfonatronovibrio hydrogenovorans]|uniref:efflux RND transporter periplasmic adaptor subunit n=1 Tax=Desulfonatronovibrio hydrogenovorans TaxID=53245 RepID=UPI00048F7483|nr:efflux RND transporter periplasmic adaptor subunit [Desulfonatronovibrio hydrogenovorans]